MAKQYWNIKDKTLLWNVAECEAHSDDIEMSGLYSDYIVYYGVDKDGSLALSQKCYFPVLRTIPNNTHATFCFPLEQNERPQLQINGNVIIEYPKSFSFDGTLKIHCSTQCGIETLRTLFPSVDKRFCIELLEIKSNENVQLKISNPNTSIHSYTKGTKGVYITRTDHNAPESITLAKGESKKIEICYSAWIASEKVIVPNCEEELAKRINRVNELCNSSLNLKTGNIELDTMMYFAKLRAGESIFQTFTGKYHSPGGHAYYAATWCNDEVEYAGPHFAMTGDRTAIEASLNAYRAYIPFMSDSYIRIPSSVISEGLDIWEGAGDRGDAAMYLYGASLFCLYLGDTEIAKELYEPIKWCAEYCERRKSPEGVICSESDELEGRFPTDKKANLSTSSLCYGGLVFASKLACSLGDTETEQLYLKRAKDLEIAIENYFGAELHGYKTYRYSKGFDTLRAWICLPLCMGIQTRKEGTLSAMLSPYLWTEEGMLTCERSSENTRDTIWDRSTLYGMKCAFLSGAGNQMMKPLLDYCHKRLVCDRVPYAVEAYPEGDKRHLSGESALFVRVITEGLFGIMPESLDSFSFLASIPEGIPQMTLNDIKICGSTFDIKITPDEWEVTSNGKLLSQGKTDGARVEIHK